MAVDFSSIVRTPGVTQPFLQSLFRHATDFYNAAPWVRCCSRHVTHLEAYDSVRVCQLVGESGSDYGIMLWTSFEDFNKIQCGRYCQTETILSGTPIGISFKRYSGHCQEVALMHKLKLTLPEGVYPEFNNFCPPFKLSCQDLRLLEAACATLPKFYEENMVRLNPYDFKKTKVTVEIKNGFKRNVNIDVKYPAGDPIGREGRVSAPGNVTRWAPPPYCCQTIGQTIDYYERHMPARLLPVKEELELKTTAQLKKCLKACKVDINGCFERQDLLDVAEHFRESNRVQQLSNHELGIMYGMANATWKLNTPETTLEAIDLGLEIVNRMNDFMEVRYFLLDLMLELDLYDDALKLMKKYPEDLSVEWFWTTSLLLYKTKGGTSKAALSALKQAIYQNPHVTKYLTGQQRMSFNGQRGYSICITKDSVEGNDNEAIKYLHNHRRYWTATEGAVEWVAENSPQLHHEIKQEKKQFKSQGKKFNMAELKILKLVSCCNCGTSDVKLRLCSACRKVGYCSRDCQKRDWKQHKISCEEEDYSSDSDSESENALRIDMRGCPIS